MTIMFAYAEQAFFLNSQVIMSYPCVSCCETNILVTCSCLSLMLPALHLTVVLFVLILGIK